MKIIQHIPRGMTHYTIAVEIATQMAKDLNAIVRFNWNGRKFFAAPKKSKYTLFLEIVCSFKKY